MHLRQQRRLDMNLSQKILETVKVFLDIVDEIDGFQTLENEEMKPQCNDENKNLEQDNGSDVEASAWEIELDSVDDDMYENRDKSDEENGYITISSVEVK